MTKKWETAVAKSSLQEVCSLHTQHPVFKPFLPLESQLRAEELKNLLAFLVQCLIPALLCQYVDLFST